MFGKKKTDVLVVGAGPVGLFAALVLARRGASVTIVDKEWRTGAHSYALALHPHSLALLEELGLAEEILAHSLRVHTVGLYDGTERRRQLQADGDGAYPLAVMPQDAFERALEMALHRAGVSVLWNHSVARITPGDQGADVTIDKLVKDSVGYGVARTEWMVANTFHMEAQYVIGADGHRSITRRCLDIDFAQIGPPAHFAVFECALDRDAQTEMILNMRADSTDVLWPLPGSRCRWSFQLLDFDIPESSRTKNRLPVEIGGVRFPVLDEQHLQEYLAERAPWFTAKIQNIDWRIVVRFEQRLASSFGHGRVWLAGDSGHLTGPAGMQSMNVGLREARQLSETILGSLSGRTMRQQFEQYGQERRDEWRQLLGQTGALITSPATDAWIGSIGQRLLPCLPASAANLDALLGQLGLALPQPAPL